MATTLVNILNEMLNIDNCDEIMLDDGTTTWDVYNLLDLAVDAAHDTEDAGNYSLQDDGIYIVDENGYLEQLVYAITNS